MKSVLRSVATLGLGLACALSSSTLFADTAAEVYKKALPSVLLLKVKTPTGGGSGTAFVVSADGWVVTNHHVIEGATQALAIGENGEEFEVAGILADGDMVNDIAVLQLRGPKVPPPLPLGESADVQPGDDVRVVGCPLGYSPSLTEGKLSARRKSGANLEGAREDYSAWELQISADISPGNSGSPVFTSTGDVIGVAVGTRVDAQGMHFAIPIERAKDMLAKLAPNTAVMPFAGSGGAALARNLGISGGVILAVAAAYFLSRRVASQKERAKLRARKN